MSNENLKKRLWIYSTLAVLIVCGVLLSSLVLKNQRAKKIENEGKIAELIPSYIMLITTQINLYEFIMENSWRSNPRSYDFKKYFPEYSSISTEELEDKIRENIVSLKMRDEQLRIKQFGGAPNNLAQQDYKTLKQSYTELMRMQVRIFESLLSNNEALWHFFVEFENLSRRYYAETKKRSYGSEIDLVVRPYVSKTDFDVKREQRLLEEDVKREIVRLKIEIERLGTER